MYNLNSVHIILQEGFKTLIYSRIWVALCVLGYTQASLVLFGGGVNIRTYSIMLMLGGYVLYVLPFFYYSIVSKKPPRNARQQWVHDHLRRFYITAGVGILIMLVMAFFHPGIFWHLVSRGLLVGLLTVLYELPLIPWRGRFIALRQYGFFKPILLTFVWWYLGVYGIARGWASPDMAGDIDGHDVLLLSIQFLFMLVLCVMFDVRDYAIDKASWVKTWPVRWGITRTRQILVCICIAGAVLAYFSQLEMAYKGALFFLFALLAFLNARKMKPQPWWFYDFVVDGMMLLQWGLLLLAGLFV